MIIAIHVSAMITTSHAGLPGFGSVGGFTSWIETTLNCDELLEPTKEGLVTAHKSRIAT